MGRSKQRHGGPRAVKRIAAGIVFGVAMGGCSGGEPSGETPPAAGDGGTGGHTTTMPAPPTPPSGKAPVCSVASDAALGTGEGASPAVAFAGGRFAAAWIEGSGLHVAVADKEGNPASHAVATGPHPAEPALAALPGGGFLVLWQEPGTVRGLHLGADASPSGSAFTIAQTSGGAPRPAAVAAAGGAAITWGDAAGVTVAEIDQPGVGGTATFAGATDPALAASGDALGLVFARGNQLGLARLGHPVRAVEPTLFRDAPGKANVPRVSPVGDGGFYVTWEDDRGGDGNEAVYLTRVGADGKPADEVPVPGDTGSANYPDVATVGGYAAVVYYQFRDGPPAIYLSLLGPDLRRAGDDVRLTGKGARFPRVASGAGALGVVYTRKGGPARLAIVTCR